MSMTSKHFEIIASVIERSRKAVQRTGDTHVLAQFDTFFVPSIVSELKAENTRFDEAKFLKACGVAA